MVNNRQNDRGVFGEPTLLQESERIRADEVEVPFLQGLPIAKRAQGAGFNIKDQTDIAEEIASEAIESGKLQDIKPEDLAQYIRDDFRPSTAEETALKLAPGLATRLGNKNVDIHRTLLDAGVSSEDLREKYLSRKDEIKESDKRTGLGADIVGGIGAFFSDPHNWVTLLDPRSKATIPAKMGFAAFMEAIVQTEVDATLEEKAAIVAGGAVSPLVPIAARKMAGLFGKSKGKITNFIKNAQKEVVDPLPKGVLKENVQLEVNIMKQIGEKYPKATMDEVFSLRAKLQDGVTGGEILPTTKVQFRAVKGPVKITADSIDEMLDTMSLHPESFSKEEMAEAFARAEDFHTPSGKYVTEFENSNPLIFDTVEQANKKMGALGKKDAFPVNRSVKSLDDGKFAVIKESEAAYIPGIRSFKSKELAQADIPKVAARFGIPENELTVLKGNFLGREESGLTWKIAQNASEADIMAAERSIPHMFDESPFQQLDVLSEPLKRESKLAPEFTKTLEAPRIPEIKSESATLDQIVTSDIFKEVLPEIASGTKKFNGQMKQVQQALDVFKGCLISG